VTRATKRWSPELFTEIGTKTIISSFFVSVCEIATQQRSRRLIMLEAKVLRAALELGIRVEAGIVMPVFAFCIL